MLSNMRLPVNVKRLYMVGSQEVNTEFRRPHVYQDCPWNQHLWKGGEGSRNRQKGKVELMLSQSLPWPNSWSTLELERLFKSVPNWAQIVQPLYSHINQSLDVSCPGKRHDLGRGSFPQLGQSLKGLTAEDYLRTALPAAGSTNPSGKGFWAAYHSVHHSGTPQCLFQAHRNAEENILF